MRRKTGTKLPAPYLKRVSLMADQLVDKTGYPYDLPWLQDREFELDFTTPVTIIVGENGTGKSTLIEAIAAHSGYDEAGGSKDHAAVDHRKAIDKSGALLKEVLRVSWLPKVTTGWFFKAETFFLLRDIWMRWPAHLLTSCQRAMAKVSSDCLKNAWHGKAYILWTNPKAPFPPSANSNYCAF